MPNKFLGACKDELKLRNCGFSHLPPEEFVKSQWQTRTKSRLFLMYRLALAIFFTACVISSLAVIDTWKNFGIFFIFLTHWGILLCMFTTTMGAVLVSMWYFHPEYADKVNETGGMPMPFKIYWIFHNTTLIMSIVITINYWTILYNDETILDANNVLTHAMNSVFMFLDLMIVAYPIRLLHFVQPLCLGVSYAIFTVIYYFAGGTDKLGNHYVYKVLDWSKPGQATIVTLGTIVLGIIIHIIIFFIYKLRYSFYSKCCTKSTIIPTNSSLNLQTGTCDGISMVHGNENRAFSNSLEKIP